MKKSVAFRMAQLSVMADEILSKDEKFDILRILRTEESIAKYGEDAPKREMEDKR